VTIACCGCAALFCCQTRAETIIVNGQTDIDLNHDGVADISFFYLPDCPSGGFIHVSTVAAGSGIVSHGTGAVPDADRLLVNTVVGPGQTFVPAASIMTCGFDGVRGPWAGTGVDGYLGARVVITGQTYYAWFLVRHHTSGVYEVVYGDYQSNPVYAGVINACCWGADFNLDGDTGTDADIEDFFACIAGDCCLSCMTADINNDGDVGTDQDIEAFFRVLAECC
jgi:hypothetical protein